MAGIDPSLLTAKRWLIMGPSGAGKSTFSIELAATLGLPKIHLDQHFWSPGWVEPDRDEWAVDVSRLAAGDAWVMDGNYSSTLAPRLARADVVLLIDPPVVHSLWSVYARSLRYMGESRPDLPEGCPEQLPDRQFLHYIISYKWRSRPKVLRLIAGAPHVHFRHFKRRKAAWVFLEELRKAQAA